ncbi:transposable element Tcb1 transposase [Trichonephila clavipes]|nr:transposable element Tcb1 transposase [Trichonephila clavipes]
MSQPPEDKKPDLSSFPRGAIGLKGLPIGRNAREKTCTIQWVTAYVNIKGNERVDSLAKEARNIDPPPIKTTCLDVNDIAKHRLSDGPRKKWCLPELNLDHVVTTTISRMRTGHIRGMKIIPDSSRTYTECRKQQSASDQVSKFNRGRIVAYRDCGLSFREIGSRFERNQTTVMPICNRWMQEGTTDRRGRSHPPQCTTSHEDKQAVCMAVTDRSVTSQT